MVKLQETSAYLVLVAPLTFILLTAIFSLSPTNPTTIHLPPAHATTSPGRRRNTSDVSGKCNIFSGGWVPDPSGPHYTNETCWAIHEHQNCMKYGRPDTGFLRWRWKPEGCEMPVLDPLRFLALLRGKSMAFVGDSVARNQMQSLICLLSRVRA